MNILRSFKRLLRKLRQARSADHASLEPTNAPGNRRIVQTARTLETINEAAENGFRPLVKPVQPDKNIHQQVIVFQDPETGAIELLGDLRGLRSMHGVMVIGPMLYYPYDFPSPFAAYLLPNDLVVGEEVWLEDLIEDIVAVWGNQGYQPRLKGAPAIWNGKDFEIQFDPLWDAEHWMG